MEKNFIMKKYEQESGGQSVDDSYSEMVKNGSVDCNWNQGYINWLEAKAAAYDRLMSGGKKTLKEWANILGKPIAVDAEGSLLWFPKNPEIGLVTTWIWYDEQFGCFGEELPNNLIDYTGDWKDSLTLPDGWEET
jgi:hypothetical protein